MKYLEITEGSIGEVSDWLDICSVCFAKGDDPCTEPDQDTPGLAIELYGKIHAEREK